MPIHNLPPVNYLDFNPFAPVAPDMPCLPLAWMPCYERYRFTSILLPPRVTQDVLSADLNKHLDDLNKDGVYFPDWHKWFGEFSQNIPSDENPVLAELKAFLEHPRYMAMCSAVKCHLQEVQDLLDVLHLNPEDNFQRVGEPQNAEQSERLRRVSASFSRFVAKFDNRYLREVPDADFIASLNTIFLEVYQRTCKDILTLGKSARALMYGLGNGDANCVAWCRQAGDQLLETLDELGSPAGAWNVCEPGMVTRMSDAVLAFRRALFPPDLAGRFLDLREKLFEQTVMEVAFPLLAGQVFNLPGNEVHVVNAWRNLLGESFSLRPREHDPFSSSQMLGSELVYQSIVSSLEMALSPAHTFELLVDKCGAEFASSFADPRSRLDIDVINSAHQSFCQVWGDVPLHVLVELDDADGLGLLYQDAILLTGWLLDKLLSDTTIPDSLKQALERDPVVSLDLGGESRPSSTATLVPSNPRLFLFDAPDRDYTMIWIRRPTASGGGVHVEYSYPALTDFSMKKLAEFFPPVLPEEDRSRMHDDSPERLKKVLLSGLCFAYMRSTAAEVEMFANQSGSDELGLRKLRKWPVGDSYHDTSNAFILQLSVDGSIFKRISEWDASSKDLWQSSARKLLKSCLDKHNGEMLSCLISSGHIDPDTPLVGQLGINRSHASALESRTDDWFENDGFVNPSIWHVPISQVLESSKWRLTDENRQQLRNAVDAYRISHLQRLRLEPEIPSESDSATA